MMRQHRLILIVIVAALAVFIVVLFSLKSPQPTLDNGSLSSPEVVLPEEVPFYLEAAIAEDPSDSTAHYVLGKSYEGMGRYDEALVSYKKAFEISQGLVTLAHIRAIEAGNPRIKPLPSETPESKELPFKGMPPQPPPQENTPPTPDAPSGLERKTGFDESLFEEPPSPKDGEATAADQRAIEELIQIIEEYEASLSSQSDPSTIVEGWLADLERSIESRPNRAESYLRLARAYQKVGEDEKAAAVYRRARERFPEDERVQREFEAEPERLLERSDEEEN